jgi:hypothetical protein
MTYFNNCYTPDELKAEYRRLVKLLHPDKGGSNADFQQMQNLYEQAESSINNSTTKSTLPEMFSVNEGYEYFRRLVRYMGIFCNHYYKFIQDLGADILIDYSHLNLIFTKRKSI